MFQIPWCQVLGLGCGKRLEVLGRRLKPLWVGVKDGSRRHLGATCDLLASEHFTTAQPKNHQALERSNPKPCNQKPLTPYLEDQGDSVSRLIMGIIRVTIWVVGIISYLLSPPTPQALRSREPPQCGSC